MKSSAIRKTLIENCTADLILYIRTTMGMTLPGAMALVYHSDTFRALQDPESDIYSFGSLYLKDLLKEEIFTGRLPVEP